MADFAVISDNKVVNVIVAETLEDAEINTASTCIEIAKEPGSPSIGWTYDVSTGNFTKPETAS